MRDDEADLDEQRRTGLEMQRNLPRSRPRREHPVAKGAGDAADLGCLLADFGPIGLLVGVGTSVVWFLKRRRRAAW